MVFKQKGMALLTLKMHYVPSGPAFIQNCIILILYTQELEYKAAVTCLQRNDLCRLSALIQGV